MEITLKNGSASARIISKGAELKSYITADGDELMWCADPKFWGKTSPILFPMIGNLAGGKTLIGGTEYFISKHGFARDNEFSAAVLSENEAEFTLCANDATKLCFPFDFKLTIKYTLLPDCLKLAYEVSNNSSDVMPYCIGAHPALAVDAEKFEDYSLVFEQEETVYSPIMDLVTRKFGDDNRALRLDNERVYPLSYDEFDEDCVYFDTIKSKSVTLKGGEKNVRLSWSGFTSLGVWTPAGMNAPFICIEPWCGCDDYDTDDGVFEHKRGIELAAAGETKRYSLELRKI